MGRVKFVLAVALSTALALSVILGGGAIADSLGSGLLASFGVDSNRNGGTGTQAAPRGFDLPVTVTNPQSMPVPVTVQGTSNRPLTATIDGTVDTNATIQGTVDTNATIQGTVNTQDINDPSRQPFQIQLALVPPSGTGGDANESFAVPAGKRLIIRYVSATFDTSPGAYTGITLQTTVDGALVEHRLPESSAAIVPSITHHWYGLDTWITADAGTSILVTASYYAGPPAGVAGAEIAISGYLVDATLVPTP